MIRLNYRIKNPRSCWNRNGDRNLNNHEKALFCIIQQTGPKSKEGIMPRVKPLTEDARCKEAFNFVLDRKRAELRYKDWASVADALGIKKETLYTWRRDPGCIPARKLRLLYKKLRYTPEEIAESMGIGGKAA